MGSRLPWTWNWSAKTVAPNSAALSVKLAGNTVNGALAFADLSQPVETLKGNLTINAPDLASLSPLLLTEIQRPSERVHFGRSRQQETGARPQRQRHRPALTEFGQPHPQGRFGRALFTRNRFGRYRHFRSPDGRHSGPQRQAAGASGQQWHRDRRPGRSRQRRQGWPHPAGAGQPAGERWLSSRAVRTRHALFRALPAS